MNYDANFLFGSATSAHQIEGGNYNDWAEWERKSAPRLAAGVTYRTDYGQGPTPVWQEIKTAAKSEANYISGEAAGHYTRYAQDLATAQSLGLTAFRFSVEWSRVEPQKGTYDQAAIAHYVDVAKACREHGQEPFVTLWHFTLPVWAAAEGGWESEIVVRRFAEYARTMGEALKPHAKHITTLNEPEVYSAMAYLRGIWPPQRHSPARYARVRRGLVQAHIGAYDALKAMSPEFEVGFCTSQTLFEATHRLLQVANDYFVKRLAPHSDWLGVQYYLKRSFGRRKLAKKNDMGWELHPEGHYEVLTRLARYKKPMFVTESGLADAADKHRAWYIEESLASIAKATSEGVDCRGYFYWSLLDNFEWHEGFWPKFGLIEVDRTTMERRLRPSAKHYAKLITQYRRTTRR